MTPTRSVVVHLTPAEAVALYEASRYLNYKTIAGGDDPGKAIFWRADDWGSGRAQLERALRGENEFTAHLQRGVEA